MTDDPHDFPPPAEDEVLPPDDLPTDVRNGIPEDDAIEEPDESDDGAKAPGESEERP